MTRLCKVIETLYISALYLDIVQDFGVGVGVVIAIAPGFPIAFVVAIAFGFAEGKDMDDGLWIMDYGYCPYLHDFGYVLIVV